MEISSRTTLVIADSLMLVRESFVCLCESTGKVAVVGQAGTGDAALAIIREQIPQLAILDFHLPGLFSLEVVKACLEAHLPTRMILISQKRDRKTVMEALHTGAQGFLLKSGPSRYLLDAIEQVSAGAIYVSPQLDMEKILVAAKPGDESDPLAALSSREYQVFTLMVEGVRAKEIAARLQLSPKTVDTYRASMMRKLNIFDVPGLVKFAIRRKLIVI